MKNKCRKKLKDKYKSVDMFGQSVGLTWNGEDTYKTIPGAVFSWGILIMLSIYAIYRLIYMVNRFNPSLSKVTLIRPADEDLPFRP